ncbi:hypothetical protein SAMN05421847_2613 [Halpernia humi]|uniref:Uncharacterized protein n=2 Tax=Halpernia humi TaxID=493375 RepID=A0A1H6AZ33_9FLAO|nr:hypothetical protein SAMN05421847_2613 [Halpernia humi]
MLIQNKIKTLKFLRYFMVILFIIFANIILVRISGFDKNQSKKIELLTEQNKIYKKLSKPKYLKTKEIEEYNKILNITQDQYNEIKDDKIEQNLYWWILVITSIIIWKLNGAILKKIDKTNLKETSPK